MSMEFVERMKARRRKKNAYRRLLTIANDEVNTGMPYCMDLAPAFEYFDAGMYEEYFDDLEALAAERVERKRPERWAKEEAE